MPIVPRLRQFAAKHPSTSFLQGQNYRRPDDRFFAARVDIELFNLPTLPERMFDHLSEALIFHVKDAAEAVIDTAQQQLVPGHGYDTGLMHDTLTAALAEHLLATGVYYDLFSAEAYYWRWVEFGHWMVNGQFWEGYHFLETSLKAHEATLRRAVREAWQDTAIKLAFEARAATSNPINHFPLI